MSQTSHGGYLEQCLRASLSSAVQLVASAVWALGKRSLRAWSDGLFEPPNSAAPLTHFRARPEAERPGDLCRPGANLW